SVEICCVCGQDVKRGTNLFANRVPDGNDYQTKVEIGRRFPQGEWVCPICDSTDSGGVVHNIEDICFVMRLEEDYLRMLAPFSQTHTVAEVMNK
ncbi:MAG: hypothetical protein Q8O76_06310, partial [Chloroflexota bacterium]|nr:hypothetical protein [Chloroflexota bacterium]